jgi:hypothetical protein
MKKNKKQKGFTLLEYTAGAAVIIGVVWVAVNAMGGSLRDVFDAISRWANGRVSQIDNGSAGGSGSGTP